MSSATFDSMSTDLLRNPIVPPAAGVGGASKARRLGALKKPQGRRKRTLPVLFACAAFLSVFAAIYIVRGLSELGKSDATLVCYTVTRSDLPIIVTERGNLESQLNTEIRSEVETFSSQPGTRIMVIVPNGKAVNKNELLVELDSAPIQDRLDNQVVTHELAKSAQIQMESRLENQKAQNETALDAAKLKVALAELNLKMYEHNEDGTYQISLQDLALKIQEAKNLIAEAQAALLLQGTSRSGMEMLYKLGYRGKGDLDQAMYKFLQAEDMLVKATNSLANSIANRKKLEEFEHPMRKLELQGGLNTAKRGLIQATNDSDSLLNQAKAAKIAADRSLAKEEERLNKYKSQVAKCKIYAPHDGMVAYSTERTPFGRMVGEGELAVERMKILSLPDLSSMQVKMMVHESVLDQVREGLPTTIQIDAFPDHSYQGTVRSVGVLPSQGGGFLSSDVKVYETVVTIDEKVEQLKPGMTAVVEIHVDRLKDVLCVPVQAIVQVEHDNWCYVEGPDGPERKEIKLGRSNDKFVQIVEGVKEGDRVVLNPMSIVGTADEKERTISPD